jgi:hypothetical protein
MSFFDLDGDGRVLDDVYRAGALATVGAAGMIPDVAPLAAAAAPFAAKGADMWGDYVSDDIKKGGPAAETGAWAGGLGGLALGGPLAGMIGTMWGSKLGPHVGGRPAPGSAPAPAPSASPAGPSAPTHHAIMSLFGGMY